MGLPQYDTSELIKSIKRRCTVPTSQLTLEPEDFVSLATDEMHDIIVPLILSARSDYFLHFEDYSLESSGVITLPNTAVGEKVRTVAFKQQDNPLILNNLPRLDLDVISGVGPVNLNFLTGFYIQDDKLMIYPNTSIPTNSTIRVYYYKRPLVLAAPGEYGRVTSIDAMNNSFVLTSVPLDWAASDLLNSVSSTQGFKTTNDSMEIISISSPTIFVDSVAGLSVGDYVAERGYSAIPQLPVEAHAFLAQLTAVKCLESVADRPGMEVAQMKADQLAKNILQLVSNRVEGSVRKVLNPSGGLRLRSGVRGSSGRWF